MDQSLGNLVVNILGNVGGLEKAFSQATGMAVAAGKRLEQIAGGIEATGQRLTAGLTLPLMGLGVASLKSFATFDDAIMRSAAIFGDTSSGMRAQLESTAKTLAGSTGTSASELAGALGVLGRSGLDAGQSMSALASVENFSIASGMSAAAAAKELADAQRVLGLRSDDAAKNTANLTLLQDELYKTALLSGASVEELGDALEHHGGAAMRKFNVPLERGLALLGELSTQGLRGARAGAKLAEILDASGGSTKGASALERAIAAAGGSTMRDATAIMGDFSHQMQNLWTNVELVGTEIGRELVPYVKLAADEVKAGLKWWGELSEEQKKLGVSLGLAAAAMGPLLVGLGSVGSLVGAVPFALFVTGAGLATDAILQLTGKGNLGLVDLAESTRICGFKMSTWLTASFLEIEKEWVELTQKVGNWKYLLGPLGLVLGDADASAESFKNHTEALDASIRALFKTDQDEAGAARTAAKERAAAIAKETFGSSGSADAAAKKAADEAGMKLVGETNTALKEQAKLKHEIDHQGFMTASLARMGLNGGGLTHVIGGAGGMPSSSTSPAASEKYIFGDASPWKGTKNLGTVGRGELRRMAAEQGVPLPGDYATSGRDKLADEDFDRIRIPQPTLPLAAREAGVGRQFGRGDEATRQLKMMVDEIKKLNDSFRSRVLVATIG